MQEEKILRRNYSIWTIFGFWNICKFIFWQYHNPKTHRGFLNWRENTGFTFIELIILVGFLLTLAAALVNIFHPLDYVKKMNDRNRIADLTRLQKGLEQYYQMYGKYPQSSFDFKITNGKNSLKWGEDGWPPYFNILPKDPISNSRQYVYYSAGSNYQSYWLYTSLEMPQDNSQACNNNCSLGDGKIPKNACGFNNSQVSCNFGLSSTNVTP